jgi:hypothetical protein
MSEETTPNPAVAQAAGMTADDLILKWADEQDEGDTDEVEETDEAVETEAKDEPEGDEPPVEGDDGVPGESESVDPQSETAPAGGDEVVQPATDKANPDVVDDYVAPPPLPTELAEIEALIDSDDYDPFDVDAQKKVIKALIGTVKGQQDVIVKARGAAAKATEEAYWASFAKENPEVGDTGRALWKEAQSKHEKRGLTGNELIAAASAEWEVRVEQAKATAKAKQTKTQQAATHPKPQIPQRKMTPGATRVTPAAQRPTAPRTPRTVEDRLLAGVYKGIENIGD